MCQSESSKIFASLPANVQSEALVYGFEMMLGMGEPVKLEEALEQALKQPQAEAGRLLALAAITALRLGKRDLALARYAQMPPDSLLKMKTLFQISIHLLPDAASELLQIWLIAAPENLAGEAGKIWLKTGELLAQTWQENNEKTTQIRQAIQKKQEIADKDC